ncbi:class I SAM-dependent methyltransferase [Parafilimonas terrae]|uniref:Methyltransferase domain-containing protein n=1 Tax=Parafilimonas terrae TaxID=1465490 RepID=A0A1I5S1J6_9BACT|nr:class I SAM-dependent methyltransferase [Parafilimonas terrae]SFP64609.1 Methyltransferase domain-containing protein [Parafilimonas terrae]
MQLKEAISLIQHKFPEHTTVWADLGCGDGLFTDALAQLLADDSLIYAVDKSSNALTHVAVRKEIKLEKLALDFVTDALPFKNLSGILMANAFHFVKDKHAFINKVFNCLNENGYLLIIEYNTDAANMWVPYPISFKKLKNFFEMYKWRTTRIGELASRFGGSMYSAIISK